MAQTHVSLLVHVVFSTKNRLPLISAEIERELFAYIGGIIRTFDSKLLCANDTSNHIHLLISLSKNILIPKLIGDVKRSSSKWIKTKSELLQKFQWQDGYSAFSVGHTQIEMVTKYVENQKAHHEKTVFEDEMRGFYRKYGISFDERYVWG